MGWGENVTKSSCCGEGFKVKDKKPTGEDWVTGEAGKFEIPALLQGGTICLVSPIKNSEWSNKNWTRSSDLKQVDWRMTTSVIPSALLMRPSVSAELVSAELKKVHYSEISIAWIFVLFPHWAKKNLLPIIKSLLLNYVPITGVAAQCGFSALQCMR